MKKNILLCVDVTTKLQDDEFIRIGREYLGVLRRDIPNKDNLFDNQQYSFIEAAIKPSVVHRNFHLFIGRHITCTKRLNGLTRLNFRSLKIDADFSVDTYCLKVANEIRQALMGLIDEA